ncbi:hypothetical protein Tco_1159564, partial [Tanacetum coccineum]
KTNEVNIEKPKSVHESVVSKPKINKDKVIIEDDVFAVKIVSPIKTNETQTVRNRVDKIGQISQKEGIGFRKIKACFDNAKRVKQQKFSNNLKCPQARRTFVPSGVLTRTGLVNPVRPNGKRAVHTVRTTRPIITARPISTTRPISTARPISTTRPVSTARPFAPKIAQTGSAIRPIYPIMDNVRSRASYSPIKRSYYTRPFTRPKDLKPDVKISGVKNMTTAGTRVVVNLVRGNPKIILQDHAMVDSGCSSHMTGNKAYLLDYKDYNGGFVAFESDPKGGKIMSKGKIRTANLDFDDVYFVDEL